MWFFKQSFILKALLLKLAICKWWQKRKQLMMMMVEHKQFQLKLKQKGLQANLFTFCLLVTWLFDGILGFISMTMASFVFPNKIHHSIIHNFTFHWLLTFLCLEEPEELLPKAFTIFVGTGMRSKALEHSSQGQGKKPFPMERKLDFFLHFLSKFSSFSHLLIF